LAVSSDTPETDDGDTTEHVHTQQQESGDLFQLAVAREEVESKIGKLKLGLGVGHANRGEVEDEALNGNTKQEEEGNTPHLLRQGHLYQTRRDHSHERTLLEGRKLVFGVVLRLGVDDIRGGDTSIGCCTDVETGLDGLDVFTMIVG